MIRVATQSSPRARSNASVRRFCFALLVSAIGLNGCGGGSSSPVSPISPVSTIAPQQQQHFAVPEALHQAVPPAPPNFIPPAPNAAQLAAARAALHNAVLRPPAGVRHPMASSASPSPVVRFHTIEGDIDVQLRPDVAPKNVANFLSYVNGGSYNNSIFHRSQSGFIIQGGGYYVNQGQLDTIAAQPAVTNEFDLSNVRGTLAMALSGSNINSATDQWFFNLANNSSQIDSGKYTVIGTILNSQGLAVMDAIGALQVVNAQAQLGPAFTQLPVVNYSSGNVTTNNLVYVNSITQQVAPEFFAGESSLGNGVYYLAFSDGNYFGYYSYLSDPHYIYHFDLGYEYVFDADDGHDGIYLYDFASNTFFYTSPSYPFPYLYDFTLNSVLYYYPAPSNAGHYTSNPRYFYEFKTGTIITK